MAKLVRIAGCLILAAVAGCGRSPAGPVRAGGRTAAELAEVLRGPDVKARRRAVNSLSNLSAADQAVVPALTAALKDPDAEVRASAATALFKIGPAAKDAVPALEAAATDRDPKVRDHAAKALAKIRG